MTIHTPQYYLDFRCLAGDCPHTCCQGWEVPIDPVTARYYESLPGPMGERLRALLSRDEMGEAAFRLRGGLCPFLNGDGLCEIYIQLGEERTGEICRTHPRFTYEYGPLTEKGLCGSCPETARLILGSDMTLLTTQEEGIGEETPELLKPLLRARETAISLFDREGTSMGERLQALLLFANEVQVLLDEGQEEALPRLCEIYEEEFPLLDPATLPQGGEALRRYFEALEGCEILNREWRELLKQGKKKAARPKGPDSQTELQARRAGVYFLYRHWLRAAWDGDILSWAEFAALGTAVVTLLAQLQEEGFPYVFRLFCEELEHNRENLDRLQTVFQEQLTLAQLLAAVGG